MKIIEQLKVEGFKPWNDTMKPNPHSSWQLRVRNEEGTTLYFVNVDLADYSQMNRMPDSWRQDLVPEYDVQFQNESGTFNSQFFGRGKSVGEALEFYSNMFKSMKCFDYD